MRHTSRHTNPAHSAQSVELSSAQPPGPPAKALCREADQPDVSHFDKLPDTALIAIKALSLITGSGVSTSWRNLHSDPDFPKAIRLSAGCTRFKVGDIRAYLTKKAAISTAPKRSQRTKGKVAL